MAYKKTFTKRKPEPQQESSNALAVELDKKKQVTVRQFNGVSLVDIREFYLDKDTGEKKPGKKGISLTEEVWNKLLQLKDEINQALIGLSQGGVKRQKTEPVKVKIDEQPEGKREAKKDVSSTKKEGAADVRQESDDDDDDDALLKEVQRELQDQSDESEED